MLWNNICVYFVILNFKITFILQNHATTVVGFIQTLTLGFKEGSVIGVFAVDYMATSPVTEDDIYSVLNAEVDTGTISDGIDTLGVMVSSLSSVEGKAILKDMSILVVNRSFEKRPVNVWSFPSTLQCQFSLIYYAHSDKYNLFSR